MPRVQVVGSRLNVDENRPCTQSRDGTGGRDEGKRGGNDLVPLTDPQRHECEQQGVRAGCTSDCVPATEHFGHFALELLYIGAQDELLGVEHLLHRRHYFGADFLELRAQIDRAYAMGVRPTHLDSHQYRLDSTGKELFEVALRLAHQYKLPFFVTHDWFADYPYLESALGPNVVVIDHTITIEPNVPPEKWPDFYKNALRNLQPGVTELVIHLAYDDTEMRAATRERETWGAAWRQHDLDMVKNPEFRQFLKDQGFVLVGWRELAKALPKNYGK